MEIMRVSTGIPGFDQLTSGGFPEGTVNLISGPAGSAKSLFSMQYLYNGAMAGEKGLYLSFEESRDDLAKAMMGFGMDLSAMEKDDLLRVIDLGGMRHGHKLEKRKKMVSFEVIENFIDSQIEDFDPSRLVIDSLSAVGLHYYSPEELREEMFSFCRELKEKGLTSLLISESIEGKSLTRYNIEQFVADSFIVVGLEAIKGELRRTITIRKMRFTRHDTSKHPFLIQKKGISIAYKEKVFD